MKNHVISGDEEKLARLKAEYDFIGRPCEIRNGELVIFALPQKPQASKKKGGGNAGRRRG